MVVIRGQVSGGVHCLEIIAVLLPSSGDPQDRCRRFYALQQARKSLEKSLPAKDAAADAQVLGQGRRPQAGSGPRDFSGQVGEDGARSISEDLGR
jgi:hypothetical protein